jgi:hypothetical protein
MNITRGNEMNITRDNEMNIKRTVPYKNICSNGTTNISTCISPYHNTRGAVRDGENFI